MLKKITQATLLGLSLLALQGCITTAVLGTAAVATKVATDPRTAGRQVDDETLEEKVSYNLGKDAQLSQEGRINVVAYTGNVLLIGQVPSEMAKETANNIATGVDGVSKVFNEIQIGQPIGFKQISKDTWITTQAKSKLLVSGDVKSTDVKVITENGEVFLMGLLTPTEANAAAESVRTINGVTKVVTAFTNVQ